MTNDKHLEIFSFSPAQLRSEIARINALPDPESHTEELHALEAALDIQDAVQEPNAMPEYTYRPATTEQPGFDTNNLIIPIKRT